MFFEGGFTFSNFLKDALAIFAFVVWFWLLVVIYSDLFRRHDISGWGKAAWVVFVVILPWIGVLTYLIVNHTGMAERRAQEH